MVVKIYNGDNLCIMKSINDRYKIIYSDIPFGTNKKQSRQKISYLDSSKNYKEFLYPRLQEAYRLLSDDGSFFLHADWHWVHYIKVWCDEVFGRDNFINEIIWSYDYGARSKKKWPTKHDNILFYSKSKNYTFRYDQIDRIPYLAPGLVGPIKAALGKTQTDVWQNTIVPTMGKEKTGYPSQKPLSILKRIIKVHSFEGDNLLDFCAGSGSFGYAAAELNRSCVLIDNNSSAIEIMARRFEKFSPEIIEG